MMNTGQPAPSSGAQHLIRLALLIGVGTFGALAWYLNENADSPEFGIDAGTLNLVFAVFAVGCIGGLLAFRQRRAAAETQQEKAITNIVGWALGEGAALFGAVILYLTGSYLPFVAGVLLMIASFSFFPIE